MSSIEFVQFLSGAGILAYTTIAIVFLLVNIGQPHVYEMVLLYTGITFLVIIAITSGAIVIMTELPM